MTCKDLMVGDYVTFKECLEDTVLTIIKIWQINGDNEAFVSIDGNDALDAIAIDDEIVGIPITPEILDKNGFKLTEVGDNGIATPRKNINRYEKYECKTKWRDIIIWYDRITKKWCLHGINSIQLNYIHELQNALRLCGIEKEIVL